jgi:ERCC4-type nuclease
MKSSPITIDIQEKKPSPTERQIMLKKLGLETNIASLDYGDFYWTIDKWPVYVERKSIRDLVTSIEDGRLARFIDNSNVPATVALLLEGCSPQLGDVHTNRRWTSMDLDDYLVGVQAAGILVLRAKDAKDGSKRLKRFYDWTGDPHHGGLTTPKPAWPIKKYKPNEREAIRFLMGYPHIGEKRAQSLLKEFRSVDAIHMDFRQGGDQAENIKGIGKGIGEKARAFVKRKF